MKRLFIGSCGRMKGNTVQNYLGYGVYASEAEFVGHMVRCAENIFPSSDGYVTVGTMAASPVDDQIVREAFAELASA
jgi:hypothetical protein